MSFYYNIHNHSMKPVVTSLGKRLGGKHQTIQGPKLKGVIKK